MPSWQYQNRKPFDYAALSPEVLANQEKGCCGRICYNCPYNPQHTKGNLELQEKFVHLRKTKTIDDAVITK